MAQIVTVLAFGRFLSARELGVVTVAISLINIAQVLQTAGVYDVLARAHDYVARMASTLVTLCLTVSGVATVLLIVCAHPLMDVIGAPRAASLIQVCAIALPFLAYSGVQMGLIHRDLDFRRRVVPDAGSSIAATLIAIVGLACGLGVWAPVLWVVSKAVLMTTLGLAFGVRTVPGWHAGTAWEIFRWFRLTVPGAFLEVVLLNIDYFFITRALGSDAAGIYSFAFRIAYMPYVAVAFTLASVSFPVYTRLSRESPSLIPEAVGRFLHATVVLVGGICLIIALEANRIVVISSRWEASVPLLRLLVIYCCLFSVLLIGYQVVRASGHPQLFLAGQIAHFVLLTGLLTWFVHSGLIAVCISQIVAVTIPAASIWSWIIARHLAHGWQVARGLLVFALSASVAGVVWEVLSLAEIRPNSFSLVGGLGETVLIGGSYAAGLYLFDRHAIREIRSVIGAKLA